MCGINGVVSRHPIVDGAWLVNGRDAMIHRGPDDFGSWWSEDKRVGLAQRRLSIIDLSDAGHQPMLDRGGRFAIVFNGEIYNYPDLREELIAKGHFFYSNSDTEVLLAAYLEWGKECLSKLGGMFAFCIYDKREQKVFVARDRAGEKPLFYRLLDGTLQFSSELKALLVDRSFNNKINIVALDCFLAMGFIPGEQCIIEGIKKLPPAHAFEFHLNDGTMKLWRYWELPQVANQASLSHDAHELVAELENLLENSVKRQLVADVPVGVLLSGGVDSSLIAALAARSNARIKTFTIRFPGHDKLDETEHARLIARHFSTEHTELEAEESTIDVLPLLAKHFDEPIADSSMIPTYLVSKLIRQFCTVALGGDGGDELFGGYNHYSRLLKSQQDFNKIPYQFRKLIGSLAEATLPVGFKGRNFLQSLMVNLKTGLPFNTSLFDTTTRKSLLKHHNYYKPVAEKIYQERVPDISDLIQRATHMDFENYLPEDILVKVDRASMANSLEVRAPFLDHNVVEFAYGKVPSVLKATVSDRKILLKNLCKKLLPPEFDFQRKQGFSVPLKSWLEGDTWLNYFSEILLYQSDGFLDKQTVLDLLNGQKAGRANSERLFALVLFELWRKEYNVSA